MNAILYRRVSSKRQAEDGNSLTDQESELREYCRRKKWEIVGNYEDAISGRSKSRKRRKGLDAAIAAAIEHQGVLLAYSLDRLARSTIDGARIIRDLNEQGAKVVLMNLGGDSLDTTTPTGKLLCAQLLAFAEYQSDLIGENVARANRATVRKLGHRTQGVQRYGWKVKDGKRVKIPDEQAVLREMHKLRRSGLSYERIADQLNEAGKLTRRGEHWSPVTVRRAIL